MCFSSVVLKNYSFLLNYKNLILLYSYQDTLRRGIMESVSACEDLPGIRNHLLLKDDEEDIPSQVSYSLLNVMDKAFAVTL